VPNDCVNRVAVRGPAADVINLVTLLEGASPFDFERVVPAPGGASDSWARRNWGVKWNAWRVTRQGYGRTGRVRYRFFTAYAPPIELLDQLSRRFPSLQIELDYDIELLGGGRIAWARGTRAPS
jgi:hypothetical protein